MAASVLALAVTVSSLAALAAAQAGAGLGTLGVERGGSCGFTAAYPAAGVYMAGLSKAIYRDGAECGACYVAACVNSKQCTNGRVKFVVTNQCLGENSTSPCVWPKAGLALQPEAFDQIASSRAPGIVPMRYSRVPCQVNGGVQLIVQTGNQYYFAVLIQNVGGPGSVVAVSVSNGKGAFMPMKRSYGAVWEINNYDIRGAALSFRLTGYNGQILALPNAIPALWQAKALYTTPLNFDLVPRPVAKQVLPAKTAQTGIVPNVGGPGQLKNVAGAQPLAQLRPLVPKYADIIRPARAAMATLGEETSGACGFLNYPRINVYKAGFSPVIFQGGFVCGACFRVSCTNSKQCLPGSVLVQASNLCLSTNASSLCADPNTGINMQPEAWDKIVNSRMPGFVSVNFQEVPCGTVGGIQFQVKNSNVYYLAVLIQNVGGPGALGGVDVMFGRGGWKAMTRSYGAVWAFNGAVVKGVPISFRLTALGGHKLVVPNALPATWGLNLNTTVFTSTLNF